MAAGMTEAEMRALYEAAELAGAAAAAQTTPTPMLVGSPRDVMGSLMGGDGGGFDPERPVYRIGAGVCGFAWINIKPGNSRFANWLKREGLARRDGYYGGVTVHVSRFDQSYELKRAYAGAFAKTLREAGIKAYAMDRLD